MINWKNSFCAYCVTLALGSILFAQTPAAGSAEPPHLLKQLVLIDTVDNVQNVAPAAASEFVQVQPQLAFLNTPELKKRLAPAQDRPIEEKLLAGIVLTIETYVRQTDYAAATVIIPPQNIAGGVVRVAVLPGKVRDVKIQGARWFSESLLREKLRMERGDPIRISELDRAITWTNSNPFRRLKVHIQPVPDSGEADLIVNVEENRPLRVFGSYDNTGNDVLGENRYAGGFTWGNAWGMDHQASYQFITTDNTKFFRAHAADYRIPLPWRHVFSVSGSYVSANPTFLEGLFTQKGESFTTEAKYTVPFNWRRWRLEASGAVGFKETNNNLEFSGMPQIGATIHVLTGSLSVGGVREDVRGNWIASAVLTASPGEFDSRSDRATFGESRLGANPRFAYGVLSLQRNTMLAPTVVSTARAMFQMASTNLVPTEQISFGGLSTVRGYEERLLSGDGGYSFTHELNHRWPKISLRKGWPQLEPAGVFFWDYGRVLIKHPEPGQRSSDYLASVGVGLRLTLPNHFSAAADYARQLEKVEIPGAAHDRLHLRMSVSF